MIPAETFVLLVQLLVKGSDRQAKPMRNDRFLGLAFSRARMNSQAWGMTSRDVFVAGRKHFPHQRHNYYVTRAGEGLSDITKHCKRERGERKLEALVYDILPPTTTIVDYVIVLEKLSANE